VTPTHGGLASALIRTPLRSALLLLGVSLACAAACLLAGLLLAPSAHRLRPPSEALRVVARPAAPGGQPGLTAHDGARLRVALPGSMVGSARSIRVAELAPPLVPVDALTVLAAEPDWLSLQGISTATGRGFNPQDAAAASPVCLVSPRIAHALSGEASPVGRHLRADGTWLTVVGVLSAEDASLQLPDLVLPLEAGLERMVLADSPGVDEVLVERGAGHGLEVLVGRVLEGEHAGAVSWDLEGVRDDTEARPSPLAALAGLLACLCLAGLLVAAQALEPILRRAALPHRGVPWRLGLLCLLLSSPGLVVAKLVVAHMAELAGLAGGLPSVAWALGVLPPALLGAVMGLLSPRDAAL
jgi:hypothetical protein